MEGTKEIDEIMWPVLSAIKKHVKQSDAVTEIYNRAYEALMISIDVNEIKEKRIEEAGNLLESISMWFYKRAGMEDPSWTEQFKSVCRLFEPKE